MSLLFTPQLPRCSVLKKIAEITVILECKTKWAAFHECLQKSETGQTLNSRELKECTAATVSLLLLKSWQSI